MSYIVQGPIADSTEHDNESFGLRKGDYFFDWVTVNFPRMNMLDWFNELLLIGLFVFVDYLTTLFREQWLWGIDWVEMVIMVNPKFTPYSNINP